MRYAPHPGAMPLYRDSDGNLVPDEVVLHQRVLLIRPDLNLRGTIGNTNPLLRFESSYLRTVGGIGNPDNVPAALQDIYPIGNTTGNFVDPYVAGHNA